MEDKEFKNLLSTTNLKADDNLKERILHQINAEKVLIPAKPKNASTTAGGHFSIFGIMHALILALAGYFYFKTDGNLLESTAFLVSALLTASTFSIYWLIVVYMEYRKVKN